MRGGSSGVPSARLLRRLTSRALSVAACRSGCVPPAARCPSQSRAASVLAWGATSASQTRSWRRRTSVSAVARAELMRRCPA
eukprot:195323-Alexandrium_andersonii.AAC.1